MGFMEKDERISIAFNLNLEIAKVNCHGESAERRRRG